MDTYQKQLGFFKSINYVMEIIEEMDKQDEPNSIDKVQEFIETLSMELSDLSQIME